jgi:hypothetical protein
VKLRTIAAVAVVAVAALLVGNEITNAQANKKVLTAVGTETCTAIDFGQWSTEPSGNTRVRGYVTSCVEHDFVGSASLLVTGTSEVTMNCNLDAGMEGQCWGTFGRPIVRGATGWEGVWEGQFSFATGAGSWKLMGHGRGDGLEGLKLEEDVIYPGGGAPPAISARVFNPKGW